MRKEGAENKVFGLKGSEEGAKEFERLALMNASIAVVSVSTHDYSWLVFLLIKWR